MAGPVTIQTDAVMARVGERTEAHLAEALRRQREELQRDWEDRQREQAEAERKHRIDAVKHWTGIVGFAVAILGAVGAFVGWWSGKVRAQALEDVRQDAMDGRLQELEAKLERCTEG